MAIFHKTFICLSCEKDSILIACLRQDFSKISLLSSATFPLKGDDETISDISKFISSYGGSKGNVYVTIPYEWVMIKFVEVPVPAGGGRDALANIVRFEIEKHIPFRIEEVLYNFQLVERNKITSKVVFASIQKERIDFIKGILERLSLKLQAIVPAPFAVLSSIELSETVAEKWWGLKKSDIWNNKQGINISVFINEDEVYFAVIKDASLIYLKSFTSSDPLNSILEGISSIPGNLSGEKINKIILSSNIASLSAFSAGLKEKIGAEVKVVNPVSKISNLIIDNESQKFAPLIGAFYTGTGQGSFKINLMPIGARGDRQRFGALFFTFFLFFTFVLIIGIFAGQLKNNKKVLTQLIERVKENKPLIKKIEDVSANIKTLEKRRTFLLNEKKDIVLLDILLELTNIIPIDAWITDFDYKEILEDNKDTSRKELIITGQANSSSSLIAIIEGSPFFEKVEFVGPVTKIAGKENFKIKALIVKEDRITNEKDN